MREEVEQLAARLYTRYCAAVGGFAFNGDMLPSWPAFRADPAKEKQANAWLAVAEEARDPGVLSGPVATRLKEIKAILNRDLTPGNMNALQEALGRLFKVLQNEQIPVPIELFMEMEDQERRVAISAFATHVMGSAMNRAAQERAQRSRIILPRGER